MSGRREAGNFKPPQRNPWFMTLCACWQSNLNKNGREGRRDVGMSATELPTLATDDQILANQKLGLGPWQKQEDSWLRNPRSCHRKCLAKGCCSAVATRVTSFAPELALDESKVDQHVQRKLASDNKMVQKQLCAQSRL